MVSSSLYKMLLFIQCSPNNTEIISSIYYSFNQLCLPDYEGYEQFEKALIFAISEGTEGFGMV